ncbi:molybdopterin-dependent oxidoreductase [Rhizobium tubonense]|uniref:Oxidoreductase molybdopterin-binding domain-containing protein n=1 Tax=Rhizobium tubonense TaxID=484088 RepID=A0A2W4EPC5_9HYPH|nr:molybdopterin-dependent oxidoreductase [Rhizobium tubonense]PZM15396.1 hypothetical protein CPY51_07275 [Rhizobium tubonense]
MSFPFAGALANLAAPMISRNGWTMRLVVGRQSACDLDWRTLRCLPHTTLPDISAERVKSTSADVCWEGVLIETVLAAIGLVPSHGFVVAYSTDGRSRRIPSRNLFGRGAMIATSCQGEPLTADCGGPALLRVFSETGSLSLSWIAALHFVTSDRLRAPSYWCDQTRDRIADLPIIANFRPFVPQRAAPFNR